MREVINNIEVNWSAKYSDASITQRIKDRLYADWSTCWVADHINVTVQNGKAILSGNVNFWSERMEAGRIAYLTEGIWVVDNRLTVEGMDYPWEDWHYGYPNVYSYNNKGDPDYIVASGSLPPGVPEDFYARTAHVARELGARIIVDTSGDALHLAVRSGVYLLKPNVNELQAMVKQELKNERELEAAAMRFIREEQSRIVVVSLGAAGVLMVTNRGCERLRAPTVPIRSKNRKEVYHEIFPAQGCHHRCGECGEHLCPFFDDQRLGQGNRPY